MSKIIFVIGLAFGLFWLGTAKAQDDLLPKFALPIDCTPDVDCWVLNYVDMDQAEGYEDPKCGSRTYDGHKGTDIALRDKAMMDKGVAVLAARDGTVQRVREGEPDRFPSEADLAATKEERKECGNAVLIDHGDGLQTLYCHLKRGSVRVRPQQEVKQGDEIAQVGLSGYTQFPHVHFGIVWHGDILDPFTGLNNTDACGEHKNSLWEPSTALHYQPAVIYDGGFHNDVPKLDDIDQGQRGAFVLKTTEPSLTFWFVMYGAEKGDQIKMNILDPDHNVFANRNVTQEKTRARQFYFVGKRLTDTNLQEGFYSGEVSVTRQLKDGTEKTWSLTRIVEIQDN